MIKKYFLSFFVLSRSLERRLVIFITSIRIIFINFYQRMLESTIRDPILENMVLFVNSVSGGQSGKRFIDLEVIQ